MKPLGLAAIGSGEIVSKALELTGFSGIDASHAVKVVYTQAPVFKVELRGPSDVMELAEGSVKGKTLYVCIDTMAIRLRIAFITVRCT